MSCTEKFPNKWAKLRFFENKKWKKISSNGIAFHSVSIKRIFLCINYLFGISVIFPPKKIRQTATINFNASIWQVFQGLKLLFGNWDLKNCQNTTIIFYVSIWREFFYFWIFCSGSAIRCAQEAWKQHDFNSESTDFFLDEKRIWSTLCLSERKKKSHEKPRRFAMSRRRFFSICRHHGELMIIGAINKTDFDQQLQKWILIYTFNNPIYNEASLQSGTKRGAGLKD